MEYNRLTAKQLRDGDIFRVLDEKGNVIVDRRLFERFINQHNRLVELEDKIEQGTLIEFPRVLRYVDYCYGLEKFVVQWVDNGKVKHRTFLNEKKAIKFFKEL